MGGRENPSVDEKSEKARQVRRKPEGGTYERSREKVRRERRRICL
jgi:hypothetical protein